MTGRSLRTRKNLALFDSLASMLKQLSIEADLNDSEAYALAGITDSLNEIRNEYVERKLSELEAGDLG